MPPVGSDYIALGTAYYQATLKDAEERREAGLPPRKPVHRCVACGHVREIKAYGICAVCLASPNEFID